MPTRFNWNKRLILRVYADFDRQGALNNEVHLITRFYGMSLNRVLRVQSEGEVCLCRHTNVIPRLPVKCYISRLSHYFSISICVFITSILKNIIDLELTQRHNHQACNQLHY